MAPGTWQQALARQLPNTPLPTQNIPRNLTLLSPRLPPTLTLHAPAPSAPVRTPPVQLLLGITLWRWGFLLSAIPTLYWVPVWLVWLLLRLVELRLFTATRTTIYFVAVGTRVSGPAAETLPLRA